VFHLTTRRIRKVLFTHSLAFQSRRHEAVVGGGGDDSLECFFQFPQNPFPRNLRGPFSPIVGLFSGQAPKEPHFGTLIAQCAAGAMLPTRPLSTSRRPFNNYPSTRRRLTLHVELVLFDKFGATSKIGFVCPYLTSLPHLA